MKRNQRHCEVLLAVQLALLGEVTPNLRAVTVEYLDISIQVESLFDGPPSEDELEGMACAETEVLALFPESHTVSWTVRNLPGPNPIPKGKPLAFLRKEPISEY